MKVQKGTGDASKHPINKQFERGPGAGGPKMNTQSDTAYAGDFVNKGNPRVKEAQPHPKKVSHPPAINAGTGGQPDGAKRVINTEKSPAGKKSYMGKSTFSAPRSGGSSDPYVNGYTKLGKV